MGIIDDILFNVINKAKNSEESMLLFVIKPLSEGVLQISYHLGLIKFFMKEQIQINRTSMAVTKRQGGSSYQ